MDASEKVTIIPATQGEQLVEAGNKIIDNIADLTFIPIIAWAISLNTVRPNMHSSLKVGTSAQPVIFEYRDNFDDFLIWYPNTQFWFNHNNEFGLGLVSLIEQAKQGMC